MSQVDKIHWLSNHGPVNPSSLLLLLGEDKESCLKPPPPVTAQEGKRVLKTTKEGAKGWVGRGPVALPQGNHQGMKAKLE